MSVNTIFHSRFCQVTAIMLLLLCPGCVTDPQEALSKEIRKAIQKADKLSEEGRYAEALRLLFDAKYKEERTLLTLARRGDEVSLDTFPLRAYNEITKLEKSLLREDPSPLIRRFRDPEFPIEEKLLYIDELRDFVIRNEQDRKDEAFQGKYSGTLIQLLTSRKLLQEEKLDMLFQIERTIQEEYTSQIQKQGIREDVFQLQQLAEQRFQEQRYVETFVLFTEARQKARNMNFSGVDIDYKRQHYIMNEFLQTNEGSLMQLFKNPEISSGKKQQALRELRKVSRNYSSTEMTTLFFEGEEYEEPLVQIFGHPKIDNTLKNMLSEKIKIIIEQGEDSLEP